MQTASVLTPRRAAAEWVWPALAGSLLLLAFWPTLVELVSEWIARPEYGHGFLMPPVAAWLLWLNRGQLRRAEQKPSLAGALLLVPCMLLLLLGEMKLSWFLKPYAFVASVGCLIWALYGKAVLRICLPSLLVLLLMCPLPGRVQRDLTLPLKRTAALFATGLLDVTGIHATLEGNLIHLPGLESLWVADACSGIRSLISLASLAVVAAVFWPAPWPVRAVVVASSVPVAVLVNGLRLWLTGFLSVHVSPEAARGFFHLAEGFGMFAIAAVLLATWAWLLALLVRPAEGGKA